MNPLVALRAALLAGLALGAGVALAADPSAPTSPPAAHAVPEPPGGTGEVIVNAGRVIWRGETGKYEFEGGVVVRRGAVTLRARSATLDPNTEEVYATGGVLLTDPTRAIATDAMRAVLDGPFHATGVVAYVKEAATDLSGALDAGEARKAGRNRLTFSGKTLDGQGSGELTATDARVTLCDCGVDKAPSWELRASKANVIPGDRVVLNWPVLYVTPRFIGVNKQVPVLVVPWLYLPLGDRHTGLLATQINSTGATGFSLAQPVFITLGRSWDTTLTPEYMFGRARSDVAEGKAAVRGFGLRTELRWAPAEGAEGLADIHTVNDLDREPGGAGGWRLGLTGYHAQRFDGSTHLRAELALASDPVWYRDFTSDVLLKSATYTRSTFLVSHRAETLVLEASAAYLQPLTPDRRPDTLVDYGNFGTDVPVAHRWPSISATLLPVGLGPLLVQGRAGFARFATLSGEVGELGPGDPGQAQKEILPKWNPAPRPAVNRGDARLQLSWPLRLGGAVSVEPFVRGAALEYFQDDAGDPTLSAWATYGISVSTTLARRLGSVEHSIEPRLQWVGGTGLAQVGGDVPLAASDQWDRLAPGVTIEGQPVLQRLSAAPPDPYQQLRLAVVNRFDAGKSGHLELELGQDLDLERGKLAETIVRGSGARGPVVGDLDLRFLAKATRPEKEHPAKYPSALDAFTQLRGNLGLVDHRGDTAKVGLVAVGPGGSGVNMAGPDALFDLRPAPLDGVAQGTLALRAVLGGATVGYDAYVPARPQDVPQCSGTGTRRIEPWHVQQHTGTFEWNSPCRCFVARLLIRVNDCGGASYSATLDLSKLAERAAIR